MKGSRILIVVVILLAIAAVVYFATKKSPKKFRRKGTRGTGVAGGMWYCTYPVYNEEGVQTGTETSWRPAGNIDDAYSWVAACNAQNGVSGTGIPPANIRQKA